MVRGGVVLVFVIVLGLAAPAYAQPAPDAKAVDGAVKTFLTAQHGEGEDTDTLGRSLSDLDGDGKPEVVLLWALLGPTYWSNTLTVFSRTVTGYRPAASLPLDGSGTLLSVEGGIILLDREIYAKDDPVCCPSIKKKVKYRWLGKTISEVQR
jgi:hypothetical protein